MVEEDSIVYYPVLIPTLNRYEHLKQCVESLQKNTHASETELVLGIDYPPSEKYYDGWRKICDYSKTIDGFKKVTIFNREKNLGARENGIKLREYAFEKYDAYIVTEDDNVFSPNFLDFVNKGLHIYKNDKKILAICGYMSPIRFDNIVTENTTFVELQEFHTWGYGKWKDRENELNNHMPYRYMEYVCRRRKDLRKLHKYTRNLYQLIFWPLFFPRLNGQCDFALTCYCKLNDKFTINPCCSLVRNIGSDGSGINTPRIMDERMSQKISEDKLFVFENNLTETEMNDIREMLDKWKDHDPMELPQHLPWRLMTEVMYFSFLLLGYDITLFLYKLLRVLYRFINRIFHKPR